MEKSTLLENVKEYLSTKETNNQNTYHVTYPEIISEDIQSVISSVLDGWFTEGKLADKFRSELSAATKSRYSVLVNSGSSANLLAVTACKDLWKNKDGDKVITCATAFPTTVAPIIQNNLIPLFIDIDPNTLTYDIPEISKLLGRKDVVGIILTHNLGFPHQANTIAEVCKLYKKWYIEDACDALGAYSGETPMGSIGDASTFSFFPAHHITTGEGGSVQTSNPKLYRLLQQYGNWGRDCWCPPGKDNTCNKRFCHQWDTELPSGYDHKYTFTKVGYNLKMTEMQAALGLSQIKRLSEFVAKRRTNYFKLFEVTKKYDLYLKAPKYVEGFSPFGFPMVASSYWTRKEFVEYLENINIRTRPIFSGNILKHPMMKNVEYEVSGELEGSDKLMNQAFFIGCHPLVTDEHIGMFEKALQDYF